MLRYLFFLIIRRPPISPLTDTLLPYTTLFRSARTLDRQTGACTVAPASPADGPDFDGRILRAVYGPQWRLLVIGANQTARALCGIATMLDFRVLVCDPREELYAGWDAPHCTLLNSMPDDAVLEIGVDARTAIGALTHTTRSKERR